MYPPDPSVGPPGGPSSTPKCSEGLGRDRVPKARKGPRREPPLVEGDTPVDGGTCDDTQVVVHSVFHAPAYRGLDETALGRSGGSRP